VRAEAVDGVLTLANTGDQLRKVVPDGREDISLAALFEIGRLLTLNKPTLVAQLMQWRRDLFGAARARELAQALMGSVISKAGLGAVGGRDALENLVRASVVGSFTAMSDGALARSAPQVTAPRVPVELTDLGTSDVLNGLGISVAAMARAAKLGAVPVAVGQAPTGPAAQDETALAALSGALGRRVDDLVQSALKVAVAPPKGVRPRRGRRKDTLDRMITEAESRARAGGEGDGPGGRKG
jgi:hypothetical protein